MNVTFAPAAALVCSEQLAAWAQERFDANGTSVDRLVAIAIEEFTVDATWVRQFVYEQIRAEVARGVSGRLLRKAVEEAIEEDRVGEPGPLPDSGYIRSSAAFPVTPATAEKAPAKRRVLAAVSRDSSSPSWAKALMDPAGRRIPRPMLSLTREELLEGSTYLAGRVALCRAIAERLKPGQRVGDVFSEVELNRLAIEHAAPALSE